MARLNVNPTRMELTRLKRRLVTARRGHKLLKDKRDELMKQFLEIVRKNKELREQVEKQITRVHASFTIVSAIMSGEMLEEALMCPKQRVSIEMSKRNIMSVNVPEYTFHMQSDSADIYPYGYGFTSGELDSAVSALSEGLEQLLMLAQQEKTAQLLAAEIERTRRRVNALEYVMIPQFEETIKYITMKLEENERGSITRLMKVKDMMVKQQIEAHALQQSS